MKKSLLIAASMAMMVTLMGCPSETPSQTASPEPSASASATPEPTPSEEPSEAPSETPSTPESTPAPSVLPTLEPGTGITLTSATAKKNADFSYTFTIMGSGLGSTADYQFLKVNNSGATITLIDNGMVREADSDVKTPVEIKDNMITFTWAATPTGEDALSIDYQLKDSDRQSSSNVRLSVN